MPFVNPVNVYEVSVGPTLYGVEGNHPDVLVQYCKLYDDMGTPPL